MKEETALQIWLEFGRQEAHFNNLQRNYRFLASTWLLASLAAMGAILKANLAIDLLYLGGAAPYNLIWVIAVATSLGIAVIGFIDLHLYHNFLRANFDRAKELEDDFNFPSGSNLTLGTLFWRRR